ncbi:hypothetical protein ACQ4M4_23400 [Leptolyngbya sp. AN02str]|uniref:hypothetical protein n=1 Tax=Leptolyngbya sp. AN02str TaxID=3423363 RepID=UPI003D3200C0
MSWMWVEATATGWFDTLQNLCIRNFEGWPSAMGAMGAMELVEQMPGGYDSALPVERANELS